MRAAVALALACVVAACGDNDRADITIVTSGELAPAVTELAALTPYPIHVVGASGDDGGFVVTVIQDPALPAQAYTLHQRGPRALDVAASDVLGAQYGTAAALEAFGFRFRHPFDTFVPGRPTLAPTEDQRHTPQIRVRGLHLHTLHPIESYFAFWEPGERSRRDAHQIIDWVIKNRGNYLQWAALDDILDPQRHFAWKNFTQELITYAHSRGVRVGLNVQLFGSSNLQLAFDLVDEEEEPVPDQIAARLPLVTEDLPFDVYDLSFGEFFNADPQLFIDAVDEVHRQLAVLAPQAEMHALIHVDSNQRVMFEGEELPYYFLVKFADPEIVPDVHSVMFYDLFEPTGGAYQHEDFAEHREFLLDRMCNGQPVAYQPETAYWVAFDNSVPQYLPLYVHNRWLDLQQLDDQPGCGRLDNHMLFSTGWEWGYWLHDVTALRASYELPGSPRELIAAELGDDLGAAVDPITALIDLQRDALMLGELVAYIAGRDTAIDAGRQLGIVSQPDRVTFDDLVGGADPVAFRAEVLGPLESYAGQLDAIARQLDELPLVDTRWSRELRDGFAIDQLRVRFVLETYGATLAHLEGDDAAARDHTASARLLLATAQTVVAARDADLHAADDRLIEATTNRTFYQFGYLFMADTLCYWRRELIQVETILGEATSTVPSCLF